MSDATPAPASLQDVAREFLTPDRLAAGLESLVILLVGWGLARGVASLAARLAARRGDPQLVQISRRGSFWLLFGLTLMAALQNVGIDMRVFLGAAGVLSVAIGFASQTSASNLISGLFLMIERPFVVGSVIRAAGFEGEVLSIDPLSVKLRTYDNLFVRIPNETLIKSEVTNVSHFPIRRLDIQVGVAYREDIGHVRDVLLAVAEQNPTCLDQPEPLFIFLGYGDSSLNVQFSVWAAREHFLELRNSMFQQIKEAFDAAGIEIPFPHRTLLGHLDAPIPVRSIDAPPRGDV